MTIDGSGRSRPIANPQPEPEQDSIPEPGQDSTPEEAHDANPFVGGFPPLPDGSTEPESDEALG